MATPYDAPIPGAAGYAGAALTAKTAYQAALARINAKRSDTLRQYGYLGDVDPTTGVLNNVRVDPYNQFGGLQQVLRSNADERQQAQFSAEERGLHGGLAHKGITDARYDLGNASQQLGSSFAGALGGYQDEQGQASYTRDQALYQAELDAARLAIERQAFNPADTSDGGKDGTDTTNYSTSGFTDAGANGGAGVNQTALSAWLAQQAAKARTSTYVHSPGANPASAKKTTTAAAKLVQNAKRKGGK